MDRSDERNNDSTEGRARTLLTEPDLLDRAVRFVDELGLCGEEENRRMVFLAGIGGMLGEPIHLIIKGDSSGGKNTLANTALKLLPEGTVLSTSGLSPQALTYYAEGDDEEGERPCIEGVLFIDEAEGLEGAEYTIRQAMSEGRVARLTVGKNAAGQMGSMRLEVDITASIITTTTATALHRENQTRVFDLWIDETEEQTRRVLHAHGDRAAGAVYETDVEERLAQWREALGELEPIQVHIPYARALADAFPTAQLRVRRDFERVLSLIRVSALLHQYQRLRLPDGTVIATLDDYAVAYRLVQEILEPTMQGLNSTALALCELHDEIADGSQTAWVKRKDLEEEAGKRDIASVNTVHKWCKELTKLGYWEGKTRGPRDAWYHRKLRDPSEEPVVLPQPEELDGPDLPKGPNSLIGRRKGHSHTTSGTPPNEDEPEGGESNGSSDTHSPDEHDWEDSQDACNGREKSSQGRDWEELGADDEDEGHVASLPIEIVHPPGSYWGD